MARLKGFEPMTTGFEADLSTELQARMKWGGWWDLNPRSSGPQPDALNLSATPTKPSYYSQNHNRFQTYLY